MQIHTSNQKHGSSNSAEPISTPDIDRVVRLNELKSKTSLSKSAIYRGIEEGTFPPPFRIGKRAVGWRLSAINAWLDAAEQNTRKAG